MQIFSDLKLKYSKVIKESINSDFELLYEKTLKRLINDYFKTERDYLGLVHWDGHRNRLDIDDYLYKIFEELPNMEKINKGTIIIKDIDQNFIEVAKEDGFIYLESEPIWLDKDNNIYIFYSGNKEAYLFSDYRLKLDEYVQEMDDTSNYVSIYFSYVDKNSELHYLEKIENIITKIDVIQPDEYLKALIGDKSYEELNKQCQELNKKLNALYGLPLSQLRKKNTSLFNDALFDNLFNYLEIEEFKFIEKEIVKNQLYLFKESGKVFRLIYTLLYTLKIFENDKDFYDYLDLTFITVSAFKVVEVVFNELLNKHFGHLSIKDSNNHTIDFSDPKLTLGNMQQFFSSSNSDIVSFLSKDKLRADNTVTILDKWRNKSRNGFLHKDIIYVKDKAQLRESITDSILLLCNIVLIFNKK